MSRWNLRTSGGSRRQTWRRGDRIRNMRIWYPGMKSRDERTLVALLAFATLVQSNRAQPWHRMSVIRRYATQE